MSDSFKNLLEQQRRQQEQQQKMWQEQLRRQQLYGYLSQQRKDTSTKTLFSCSACGSTSGVASCPMCKRSFCRIHLPVKSFSNIHLPAEKTGIIGHVCILSRQGTERLARPSTLMRPLTENKKQVQANARVSTVNKWKCPICDHLNSKDTDICEECGVYSGEHP